MFEIKVPLAPMYNMGLQKDYLGNLRTAPAYHLSSVLRTLLFAPNDFQDKKFLAMFIGYKDQCPDHWTWDPDSEVNDILEYKNV